jgi:hypothetical protein
MQFIKENKKRRNHVSTKFTNYLVAVWTGLEPATSCVTGRHSNQLNYQTKLRGQDLNL